MSETVYLQWVKRPQAIISLLSAAYINKKNCFFFLLLCAISIRWKSCLLEIFKKSRHTNENTFLLPKGRQRWERDWEQIRNNGGQHPISCQLLYSLFSSNCTKKCNGDWEMRATQCMEGDGKRVRRDSILIHDIIRTFLSFISHSNSASTPTFLLAVRVFTPAKFFDRDKYQIKLI